MHRGRRIGLCLLVFLVFSTCGSGDLTRAGFRPPTNYGHQWHDTDYTPNIVCSPASLFYLFHLRSCAASAVESTCGSGFGGCHSLVSSANFLGVNFLKAVGWYCHAAVQWCQVWADSILGPGLLWFLPNFVIRISGLPGWLYLSLGAYLGNFHRPPSQCRFLSCVTVYILTRDCHSWIVQGIYSCGLGLLLPILS